MKVMQTAIACCVLLSVAARAVHAEAAEAGSVASVLSQAKAAAGGAALDDVQTLHLSERVRVLSLSGTGNEYDDLARGRFAQYQDLGPLSNGNGFDGSQSWTQDPSGDAWPVGDYVDTRAARTSSYLTSLSFWYPARLPGTLDYRGATHDPKGSYDVIRAYPAGGFPADIWFDAQTHLISREIIRIPNGRDLTLELSDYRHVGDIVLPFAVRSIANGNAVDVAVNSIAINTEVSKHIAMPKIAIDDFSIAGGSSTTIPFQLVNNHLYISLKLDGSGPYRFIFDTGGQNVMTPEVAAKLGIAVVGTIQMMGAGANTVSSGFAWVPQLQVGAAVVQHQSFAVLPIGKIIQAVEGERVDGIVGVEVLRRFITTIDYQRSKMTFATRAGAAPRGNAIPFVYDQAVPLVAASADGLDGRFIIDTGNRSSLVFYAPFVQTHRLLQVYPSKVDGITGFGLGGPSTGQLVRVKTLSVGPVAARDVVATLSRDTMGAFTEPGTAGNLGGGFLKRFTVGFDYRKQIMYLAPNSDYDKLDPYDRSGLFLVQTRAGMRVIGALTATPAYEAGIRSGDTIVSVNGRPALSFGLLDLRSMLRAKPGTVVQMVVQSGATAKNVSFTLRDYV